MTDVARKWRVPEFVGLGLLVAVAMLIEESVPEYEQFIPPVSFKGTWYLVIWYYFAASRVSASRIPHPTSRIPHPAYYAKNNLQSLARRDDGGER